VTLADVTLVLTYTAQASHDMVPSDALDPLVKGIANSFISERSSPESIAVGSVSHVQTPIF
jgi:protein SDA1